MTGTGVMGGPAERGNYLIFLLSLLHLLHFQQPINKWRNASFQPNIIPSFYIENYNCVRRWAHDSIS